MSAIYFHIPFCRRLCGYCDFFKSVKLQQMGATLDAMEREVVEQRPFLSDHSIETIYFGGGTPSLVEPQRIARLIDLVHSHYNTDSLEELTLEVNPDDLTPDYLLAVREAGINRLSIGIQSFDDEELRMMNRRHSAQQARDAVLMAREAGFENITIDLIFGVDGFGEESLRRSVEVALSLNIEHISAYHLTIESGTPFAKKVAKGEMRSVSEGVSEVEYKLVETMLTAAGYDHYEVSNYAREGYRSRHNSSYWHGVQYLGIGPAAHSFNGDERRAVCSSIEQYLSDEACRYSCEQLTEVDHYNEAIMTSLRCREGIDLREISERFAPQYIDHLMRCAKVWIDQGRLLHEGSALRIPTSHFLLSDLIIESLFY